MEYTRGMAMGLLLVNPQKLITSCHLVNQGSLAGFGGGLSGLCTAWAHEICADDNEERAIVIASMNEMAYVLQAWLPLIVWQQVDAPQYQKGFMTISCLSFMLIVTAFTLRAAHHREIRL